MCDLSSCPPTPPPTQWLTCQCFPYNVNNPLSSFHTPSWLCMQRTPKLFFIALSYILQAAKDILYWKGNASSRPPRFDRAVQTVCWRWGFMYMPCDCLTVLTRSYCSTLLTANGGRQQSLLPDGKITGHVVSVILWSVCCLFFIVSHTHTHSVNMALISGSLICFADSLNAVYSGSVLSYYLFEV